MSNKQKSMLEEIFPVLSKNAFIDKQSSGSNIYLNCCAASGCARKLKFGVKAISRKDSVNSELEEQEKDGQNELRKHREEVDRERRKDEARYPYL